MIVAIAFAVLLLLTGVAARSRGEWLVDGSGLLIQGAIATLFAFMAPRGRIELPFAAQFAISFVVVDYAFYWNHRLLHGAWWRWHAVHHTARRLDVVVTSRNTLWTPLLIVYVWTTAAAVLLFRDPRGWLLGISVTAALDLWRHSSLALPSRTRAVLSLALITPHEHAWHHSTSRHEVNFGANLSIWDRMHGTYAAPDEAPESLGVETAGNAMTRLLLGDRRRDAGAPSLLGRMLAFFPALQIALCIAAIALAFRSPWSLLAIPLVIYAMPVIVFRIINAVRPLHEGRSFLDGPRYSPWWGAHNLQRLFIGVPQLESLLQLIPGAFSVWLRCWGSRVGRRVHWTPRVEVADRSLLDVGDDAIVGHKFECYAHAIKPSRRGRLILYVKRIRIGSGAFIGAGVRMGPGARVNEKTFVPTLTDVYIDQEAVQ